MAKGRISDVFTLGNTIIGVSVLAMPYCFRQCGVILGVILLLANNLITRLTCHMLLKSASITRSRTYPHLALQVLGSGGKLLVELGTIGFLFGTCVAFYVVMGDLVPEIVGSFLWREFPFVQLRILCLVALAFFVVLPLCLVRDISSLAGVATVSFVFYGCLVCKILLDSLGHIYAFDFLDRIVLWRPEGALHTFPILAMALSCQTQLFDVYEGLPEKSVHNMNAVVSSALYMCCIIYCSIGVFGYIGLCHIDAIPGNILVAFSPSGFTKLIKLGFALSVAGSFPLCLFPLRTSLYSLCCSRETTSYQSVEGSGAPSKPRFFIPDVYFRIITVLVVISSLVFGILLPNIEAVLSILGSTVGTVICILLPSVFFMRLSLKHSNDRLLGQVLFSAGVFILIASTYSSLQSFPVARRQDPRLHVLPQEPAPDQLPPPAPDPQQVLVPSEKIVERKSKAPQNRSEKRVEPPVPVAPAQKATDEEKSEQQQQPPPETVVEKKKEEKEQVLEQKKETDETGAKLIAQLELQAKESKKLLEEQKQILDDMKKQLIQSEEKRREKIEKEITVQKVQEDLNLQPPKPNEYLAAPPAVVEDVKERKDDEKSAVEAAVDLPAVEHEVELKKEVVEDGGIKANSLPEQVPPSREKANQKGRRIPLKPLPLERQQDAVYPVVKEKEAQDAKDCQADECPPKKPPEEEKKDENDL